MTIEHAIARHFAWTHRAGHPFGQAKPPQTLFDEAKRTMPKFAIGDVVDIDKTHSGTVVAVFTTMEGEQRYAVDMEGYGAFRFIMECNLVRHETPH